MTFVSRPRYFLRTLGCKANLVDSQQLEAELLRRGWTAYDPAVSADGHVACIVNSCTVTDEADRQSRRLASKLAREIPGARVVVTGCSAEVDPERLARSRGIHYVIANRDKPRLAELIEAALETSTRDELTDGGGELLGAARGWDELLSRHPIDREWSEPARAFELPEGGPGLTNTLKTRAFIKIQEGCDAFCTYCIIPYGRGPSRLLEPSRVVEQIRELVARGTREVIFTGTNLGDYDTSGAGLEGLARRVLAETELARLRISSLDPAEITPGLLELMRGEPRFCPHFHVSLQSPTARILRLMKRKYSEAEVDRCLHAIAGLGREVFVGMDVITGFPGEDDAEFERGLERLRRLPWTRLHVFPYSERDGTPATRLPGSVPMRVRQERARILNALSLERLEAHHRRVATAGATLSGVLFERLLPRGPGEGTWVAGYTPDYLRVAVRTSSDNPLFSQIADVRAEELSVQVGNQECLVIASLVAEAKESQAVSAG